MLTIASMIVSLFCGAATPSPVKCSEANHSDADQDSIDSLREAAHRDWAEGRFAAAATKYRQIIELDKTGGGGAELPTEDLRHMAVLSTEVGLVAAARVYYQLELDILEQTGRGTEAGSVYIALGEISQSNGDYPKAESEYKKAIAALERTGPGGFSLAIALDNLGWLYVTCGRLSEGSGLLDEARSMAEQASAGKDPRLIRHLDTQAAYRSILGQHSEAQRLWRRALTLREGYYGPQGYQYNNVLVHFGQASVHSGDYQTAKDMFERYLAIESRIARPLSAPRAVVTGELANLFTQQHQYAEAEPVFQQALELIRVGPEKSPLSLSLILSYYGDYFMARGDWTNAEQRFRQALALQEEILGDTRVAASSMEALSKALRKQHRKKEADQLAAKAGSIRAAQPGLLFSRNTVDVQSLRQH
jgi:tetratricopeptide (TPR) repeat protein